MKFVETVTALKNKNVLQVFVAMTDNTNQVTKFAILKQKLNTAVLGEENVEQIWQKEPKSEDNTVQVTVLLAPVPGAVGVTGLPGP